MPRRIAVLTTLLFALQVPPQPDFSGRWVLDSSSPAPPDAPRVLAVEQPVTRTNVHGEPMPPAYLTITIRRESAAGVTSDTRRIGVVGGMLGGVIGATGERMPTPEKHFETGWRDPSRLFMDHTNSPDGPHTGDWSERRETWSLEADGRLRVEIVSETKDQPPLTTVAFYTRE